MKNKNIEYISICSKAWLLSVSGVGGFMGLYAFFAIFDSIYNWQVGFISCVTIIACFGVVISNILLMEKDKKWLIKKE